MAVDAVRLSRDRPGGWDRVATDAGWESDTRAYRSPADVRRHWFAEWRRRMGYGPSGDFDNTVLVTARKGKGYGKSALALDAGLELDKGFAAEYRTRIAFRAADFLDMVNSLSRGEVGILDEAGEGLLKLEPWSDAARLITKAMIVSRDTHATLFLCIPTVSLFNGPVMNSLVDYWLCVEERGTAQVHPRPPERYTRLRGIGWFPDREWNPLIWDRPLDWDDDRRRLWGEYRKLRKEFRRASLDEKAAEIRSGRSNKAAEVSECPACGLRGNPYNVRTHKCRGSRA